MLQNLSYKLVEKGFPQWCCGSPTGLCKPRQLDTSAGLIRLKSNVSEHSTPKKSLSN